MSRYTPKHSARASELEATAQVRRLSYKWTAIAAAGLTVLVALVMATSGGWDQAVRSFSGQELKEQEEALRARLATDSPEATAAVEPTSP